MKTKTIQYSLSVENIAEGKYSILLVTDFYKEAGITDWIRVGMFQETLDDLHSALRENRIWKTCDDSLTVMRCHEKVLLTFAPDYIPDEIPILLEEEAARSFISEITARATKLSSMTKDINFGGRKKSDIN